eukprot:SAG11_NODE_891_length_6685_cov_4.256909_6_plen_72_part_00
MIDAGHAWVAEENAEGPEAVGWCELRCAPTGKKKKKKKSPPPKPNLIQRRFTYHWNNTESVGTQKVRMYFG